MLTKLKIQNVALIDCAEIDFERGLNVLSGETGSGKSVIVESLNFVLGAKADKTMIRSGEKECCVSAVFDVKDNSYVAEIFNDFDFEPDDTLVITRKFNIDGKSSIKINGNSATVSMIRKFTSYLVDVHGQSEHFYLLKKSNQLELIDTFCGDKGKSIKEEILNKYKQLKENENKINELGGDEKTRLTKLDVLNFQINEISVAELKKGEEEELVQLKQKLLNYEKITTSLSTVKEAVIGEGGTSDILSNAYKSLSNISSFGTDFAALSERLNQAIIELQDIADSAENFLDESDLGNIDANYVEERLDLIKNLKRKYGDSIETILDYLNNAVEEKELLENFNLANEKLLIENNNIKKDLFSLYSELSSLRKKTAKEFSKNVLIELKDLGMEKAKFEISFGNTPNIDECLFNSANGFDELEFLFSANLGEPVKPLSYIISGGEASRFMLAIKTQARSVNGISTYIFDEIDAGISGKIAKTVAEKFAKIALNAQIIAITHLPQISVMADNNLLISKSEQNNKTKTEVFKLDKNEKINEIIRLIGGESDSESAKVHAKELIAEAEKYKNAL